MDEPENIKEVGGDKRLNKRVVSAIFLGATVLAAGVCTLAFGFGSERAFLKSGIGLVSETLGDIFYGDSSNGFKQVAEIDLANGNLNTEAKNSVAVQTGMVVESFKPPAAVQKKENAEQKIITQPVGVSPASEIKKANLESPPASDSSAIAATSSKIADAAPVCDFSAAGNGTHKIILSEIAWMGSLKMGDETAAQASQNEWMELKNNSDSAVNLAGWQILDESEKFNIIFSGGDKIAKNDFYLLERTDDDSVPNVVADKIYSGALPNAGEWLRIFDDDCALVDEVNASDGWPSGDNVTKQTLERNTGDFLWHTSAAPGGTAGAANSAPVIVLVASSSAALDEVQLYALGVSIQGGGAGLVMSSPAGIHCGFDCSEQFRASTKVVLSATPDVNSAFENWSGVCVGTGNCTVIVTGTVSVVANFKSTVVPPQAAQPVEVPQTSSTSTSTTTTTTGPNHLVISEVQIGNQNTDDFVRIFNPLSAPFSLKGYRLVKRAKTSTSDTSLKSWANDTYDTFIPAGGYYTWANSSFTSLTPPPDATTTASIAGDSGVAIRQGPLDTGVIIDAVAWGASQNFIEGNAYATNPEANQILSRKIVNGAIQDTGNNAQDFEVK